ncbi:MBOAT family O-acyltransferase [Feifania hominis]|uniref:MBOAT family protein n=1 Tax=Feifania hominis TaxID=2763660 RepID=A0A926HV03_9FIRM|nr:MBOAT family protein [Feifania hominis]MBC8536106.1 MBOAT family protein [Feifania hominis]
MVFSSLLFLFCFLPLVLAAYYLCPRGGRNFILFVFSLVFYAWGEPVYVVLMLFSTLVDYVHGLLVRRALDRGKRTLAKLVVASSAIINLGLLGFFKYADFLIGTLNAAFGLSLAQMNLPLPIGISFYTFQTMSYTIDVYRGDAPVQRNIISFGAYVAMFPQLIAGPIVRYQDVAEKLTFRRENLPQFLLGVERFLRGLFKKVLIANNVGMLWDTVYAASSWSVLSAWLGVFAFAFQIYFDFSGYSDMAIGLGHMFGFDFPENFDHPYVSKSISEFWRRWHITLGTWFREYVYIPLGGNRKGMAKTLRNMAIVWLCTGLWHGASWNFVLWGAYFGVIIIVERLFLGKLLERLPGFLRHLYTLFLIGVSWVIFSFENLGKIGGYLGAMFGGAPLVDRSGLYSLVNYLPLLVLFGICATPLASKLMERLRAAGTAGRCALGLLYAAALFCSLSYLVDATYNPFLYFRF